MTPLVLRFLETIIFPPLSLILLGAAGLVLLRTRRPLGAGLIAFSLLLLYAASMPLVARGLVATLEGTPPIAEAALSGDVGAIVVLGSRIDARAPEYGGASLNGTALERLRYGARLHWFTGRPILVSGGPSGDALRPEAALMKEVLEEEFGVPVRWSEERSRNTHENALYSREILSAEGIERVYLVTHAIHMPRARRAFEKAGFEVVPAPTMFARKRPFSVLDLLPQGEGLAQTAGALHEWLARLWYGLRGRA